MYDDVKRKQIFGLRPSVSQKEDNTHQNVIYHRWIRPESLVWRRIVIFLNIAHPKTVKATAMLISLNTPSSTDMERRSPS